MPSLLEVIPQTIRGIMAAPQGYREEGGTGIAKAFIDPSPYERSNRVRDVNAQNLDEEQAINNMLDQAQSVDDLGPAVGLFQKLQGEAYASGLVEDQAAYDRVLGPIQDRIRQKVRALTLGETEPTGVERQLARGSIITGDEELGKQANVLAQMRERGAIAEAAKARQGLSEARTTTEQQMLEPRTRAATALANRREAGPSTGDGGGSPTAGVKPPTTANYLSATGQLNRQEQGEPPRQDPQLLRFVQDYEQQHGIPTRAAFTPTPGPPQENRGLALGSLAGGGGIPAVQQAAPPELQPTPTPGRIEIPDVRQAAAASLDEHGRVSTGKLIAYYQQKGLSPQAAVRAAQAAVQELSGGAAGQ